MGSLDIHSLFTNTTLEETIKFALAIFLKTIVHSLKKSEFKYLLSLATKEPHFIFNNISYQQIEELGSP